MDDEEAEVKTRKTGENDTWRRKGRREGICLAGEGDGQTTAHKARGEALYESELQRKTETFRLRFHNSHELFRSRKRENAFFGTKRTWYLRVQFTENHRYTWVSGRGSYACEWALRAKEWIASIVLLHFKLFHETIERERKWCEIARKSFLYAFLCFVGKSEVTCAHFSTKTAKQHIYTNTTIYLPNINETPQHKLKSRTKIRIHTGTMQWKSDQTTPIESNDW